MILKTGRKRWSMDSTSIKFIHYTSEPLVELNSICYIQNGIIKPNGLWFSVEGFKDDTNWFDWCCIEEFRLENLKHRNELILDTKSILWLDTPESIAHLTTHFSVAYPPLDRVGFCIDWGLISKLYDGIIIAPYQYCMRFSHQDFWYYGWDCASGCVWNLERVRLKSTIQ